MDFGARQPIGTSEARDEPPRETGKRWGQLRKTALARDVALVIALKVTLVFALYVLLIRSAPHPAQDPESTASAITGSRSVVEHEVSR